MWLQILNENESTDTLVPVSQRLSPHQVGASYVHWIQEAQFFPHSTYLQYMLLAPESRVSHVLVQQERRAGFQYTSVFQQYVVPDTIGGIVT